MVPKLLVAVLGSASVAQVLSHSWLECTDYRITPGSADTKVWNPAQCFGHARCGKRQADEGFGVDTGLNFHSTSGCQCARGGDNYDGVTKAVYTAGQRVCLAYPSKNHVSAPCTNANIPDTGTVITRSPAGASSDSDIAKEYTHSNGGHVDGQMDYKGFQNCPNFCSDMDKSLCTMCFDLESDLAPGDYTFRWVWAFNSESDMYTTCWEAEVREGGSGGGGANPAGTAAAAETTTSPVAMSPTAGPDAAGAESVTTEPASDEPEQLDQPLEVDCEDDEATMEPATGESYDLDCDDETEQTLNSYTSENEEAVIPQETQTNEPTTSPPLYPPAETTTTEDEYAPEDYEADCEVGPDASPEDGPGVVQAYPPQ